MTEASLETPMVEVKDEKLLPCPFCGAEPELFVPLPTDRHLLNRVTCRNIDCHVFGNFTVTVDSWNSRPSDERLAIAEEILDMLLDGQRQRALDRALVYRGRYPKTEHRG